MRKPRTIYIGPAHGWETDIRLANALDLEPRSRMAAVCASILDYDDWRPELSTAQPPYDCRHACGEQWQTVARRWACAACGRNRPGPDLRRP